MNDICVDTGSSGDSREVSTFVVGEGARRNQPSGVVKNEAFVRKIEISRGVVGLGPNWVSSANGGMFPENWIWPGRLGPYEIVFKA